MAGLQTMALVCMGSALFTIMGAYDFPKQKTMGHSTPTVTANIYSDLYSDELDQVATNLDRLHASDATAANGQEPDTKNQP